MTCYIRNPPCDFAFFLSCPHTILAISLDQILSLGGEISLLRLQNALSNRIPSLRALLFLSESIGLTEFQMPDPCHLVDPSGPIHRDLLRIQGILGIRVVTGWTLLDLQAPMTLSRQETCLIRLSNQRTSSFGERIYLPRSRC